MRRRSEIDDLDLVGLSHRIDEHDVLGLEIGMNEAELLELAQREQHLLHDRPNALERQRRELVLLEKVVKVLFEHLEHETRVIFVLKDLVGAYQIVLVGVLLAQTRENAHFDLALSRVARVIFQNFYGHDLIRAFIPTFNHLTECSYTTTTKREIRNQIKQLVKIK